MGIFPASIRLELSEKGIFVIDNSSAWRMNPEIPLIVPEVNGDLLASLRKPSSLANPNCSTMQMVVVLAPLRRAFGLAEVHVATYQSASGAGQKGIEALKKQQVHLARNEDIPLEKPC